MHGEAAQMAVGFFEGLNDQLRMLRHWDSEAWRTQLSLYGKHEFTGIHAPAVTAANFGLDPKSYGGIFVDWTGRALRLPMEILNGTDAVGKAVNGRMMHRVEAFRQATNEGHLGTEFNRRVDELLEEPWTLNGQALQRIEEFKEAQTFTKSFEPGGMLERIQRGPGPAHPVAELFYRNAVLAFFRTPVRIAEYAAQHTPLLNVLSGQIRTDLKAGGVARQTALAKVVVGTGIMAGFGYMESLGQITGSGPRDPELKRQWEASGWQEKSFWDPVNSKWRSYDGLEPIATLIAVGADVSAAGRAMPEADYLQLFTAGVLAFFNHVDSKTYLQGISQIKDIMAAPGPDAQVAKALHFAGRNLVGMVPVAGTALQLASAGAVAEVEKFFDPTRRRAVPSGAIENPFLREFDAMLQYYRSRIPGLSSERDKAGEFKIAPWRNSVTGEVAITENFPFLPFPGRTPKYDPVFAEIIRLEGAGLKELPTYIGAREAPQFGLQPARQQRPGVQLTPQEADRWVVLMTQVVKNGKGQSYHEALAATITSPAYQRVADRPEQQKAWLKTVEGEFKERSKRELFTEYPKLRALFYEEQVEQRVQRAPTSQREQLRDTLRNRAGLNAGLGL
jgi:hypothetical protein